MPDEHSQKRWTEIAGQDRGQDTSVPERPIDLAGKASRREKHPTVMLRAVLAAPAGRLPK
jgi:hypothetical protein